VNHYGNFDVKEITVKLVEGAVLIEGKQEWRSHPGGRVWKAFAHQHNLPKDVDTEKLSAFMSGNGVLMIRAPRVPQHRQRILPEQLVNHFYQQQRNGFRGSTGFRGSSISMKSLGLTIEPGKDMEDSIGSEGNVGLKLPMDCEGLKSLLRGTDVKF